MRTALAVLTYVPKGCSARLRMRLADCLSSLEKTKFPGQVFVVDDGSTDSQHLGFLKCLDGMTVIRRKVNGGVWRAKNTCLKVLSEADAQIGFILEDDAIVFDGWHQKYIEAHQVTGIQHFSWGWDESPSGRMKKTVTRINGHPVEICSMLNGVLLTFTPEVIRRVGGFRPMPHKWGHTHTNWTKRVQRAGLTPFYADILHSNQYVRIGRYGDVSAVSAKEKQRAIKGNRKAAEELDRIHWPLTE